MHLLKIIAVVSVAFVLSTELFAFPAPVKHSLEQQEEQRRLSHFTNGITKHGRSVQGFFEPNFERDVDDSLEEEQVNFGRGYDDNDQHVRGLLQPNVERDDDGLQGHSIIERELSKSSRDDHIGSVPRSDSDDEDDKHGKTNAQIRKLYGIDLEKGKGKSILQKAGKALAKAAKAVVKPSHRQKSPNRHHGGSSSRPATSPPPGQRPSHDILSTVGEWKAKNLGIGGKADPPWQGSKRSVDVIGSVPRGDSDDDDDKDSKTSSEFRKLFRTDSEKARSKGKGVLQKAGNALKKAKEAVVKPIIKSKGGSSSRKDTSPPPGKRPQHEIIETVNEWKAKNIGGNADPPWQRPSGRSLDVPALAPRGDSDDEDDDDDDKDSKKSGSGKGKAHSQSLAKAFKNAVKIKKSSRPSSPVKEAGSSSQPPTAASPPRPPSPQSQHHAPDLTTITKVDRWKAGIIDTPKKPTPWKMFRKQNDRDLQEDLDTRGDSDDEDDDDDASSSKKSSKGLLQTLSKVKAGFRDKKRGKKHGSDSSSSGKGIGSSSKPQPSRWSSKSSSSAKSTPAGSPTASPERSPPRPDDETIEKVDEWKAQASKGLPKWTPRPWRKGSRSLSSFSLFSRDDDDGSSDSGSALRKLFGSPDGSKKGLLKSISGKAVKPILSHSDTYSPGGTPTDSINHSGHSKEKEKPVSPKKEKAVSPKKAVQAVAAGPSFRHPSYKRPSSVGNPSTSLIRPSRPVRLQSSSFKLPKPIPILDPHAHNVAKIERWKAEALREGAIKPEPWQGAEQRDLPDEHLFKRFLNKMKKAAKAVKTVVKLKKSDSDSKKSDGRSAEVSPAGSPRRGSRAGQRAGTSSSTFRLPPASPNTLAKVRHKVESWHHDGPSHKAEDHWTPPPGYKTEHKDLYPPGSPDHGTAKDLYPPSDSEKRDWKQFIDEAGDSSPEHSERDLIDTQHSAEEDFEARVASREQDDEHLEEDLVARLVGKLKEKAARGYKKLKKPKSSSGSDDEGSQKPLNKPPASSASTPSWQKQASEHGSHHGSSKKSGSEGGKAETSRQSPTSSPESYKGGDTGLAAKVKLWQLDASRDPPSDHDDRRDLSEDHEHFDEDLVVRLVDKFKKAIKGKAKKAAKKAKSSSGSDEEGSHQPLVKPKEGSTPTPSWQKQAYSKGSEHGSRHGSGSSSPVSSERAGPSFQPPPHKSPETKWERQKQLEHTVDRWKLFSLGEPPSDHEDEDDRRDLNDDLSEEQYLEERLVSEKLKAAGKALKSVVKGKPKSEDHPSADSDKKSERPDKSEAGRSPGGVSPFWELEGKVGSSSKPSRDWKNPMTWGKGNKRGKQNAEAAMKYHDSPYVSPTKWFAGSGHQSPSSDHGDSERRDLNDLEEDLEARLVSKIKDKVKGKGKKKKAKSSSSQSSPRPAKHAYDEAGGGSDTTTPEWLHKGTGEASGYPSSSSSSSSGSGAGASSPPAWKPTSPKKKKKKYFWQNSKKLEAKELAKKVAEWQGDHSDDEKKDDRRDLNDEEDLEVRLLMKKLRKKNKGKGKGARESDSESSSSKSSTNPSPQHGHDDSDEASSKKPLEVHKNKAGPSSPTWKPTHNPKPEKKHWYQFKKQTVKEELADKVKSWRAAESDDDKKQQDKDDRRRDLISDDLISRRFAQAHSDAAIEPAIGPSPMGRQVLSKRFIKKWWHKITGTPMYATSPTPSMMSGRAELTKKTNVEIRREYDADDEEPLQARLVDKMKKAAKKGFKKFVKKKPKKKSDGYTTPEGSMEVSDSSTKKSGSRKTSSSSSSESDKGEAGTSNPKKAKSFGSTSSPPNANDQKVDDWMPRPDRVAPPRRSLYEALDDPQLEARGDWAAQKAAKKIFQKALAIARRPQWKYDIRRKQKYKKKTWTPSSSSDEEFGLSKSFIHHVATAPELPKHHANLPLKIGGSKTPPAPKPKVEAGPQVHRPTSTAGGQELMKKLFGERDEGSSNAGLMSELEARWPSTLSQVLSKKIVNKALHNVVPRIKKERKDAKAAAHAADLASINPALKKALYQKSVTKALKKHIAHDKKEKKRHHALMYDSWGRRLPHIGGVAWGPAPPKEWAQTMEHIRNSKFQGDFPPRDLESLSSDPAIDSDFERRLVKKAKEATKQVVKSVVKKVTSKDKDDKKDKSNDPKDGSSSSTGVTADELHTVNTKPYIPPLPPMNLRPNQNQGPSQRDVESLNPRLDYDLNARCGLEDVDKKSGNSALPKNDLDERHESSELDPRMLDSVKKAKDAVVNAVKKATTTQTKPWPPGLVEQRKQREEIAKKLAKWERHRLPLRERGEGLEPLSDLASDLDRRFLDSVKAVVKGAKKFTKSKSKKQHKSSEHEEEERKQRIDAAMWRHDRNQLPLFPERRPIRRVGVKRREGMGSSSDLTPEFDQRFLDAFKAVKALPKFGKTKTTPWPPGPDEDAKQAEKIRKNAKALKGTIRFDRRQALDASFDLEPRKLAVFNSKEVAAYEHKKIESQQSSDDVASKKKKYMKDRLQRIKKWHDRVKQKKDAKDKIQRIKKLHDGVDLD